MVPRKPLQFVSCITIFSLVPDRTLESAFTSSTAAANAAFATLPITELNVNIIPMVTELGLEWELAF